MCKLKIYKEMTVNNVCNVAVVVCLVRGCIIINNLCAWLGNDGAMISMLWTT